MTDFMGDRATKTEPTGTSGIVDVMMSSTSYPSGPDDWRGLFIRHLVQALANRHDISLRLWAPPGDRPESVGDATTTDERAWLAALSDAGGIMHLLRTAGIHRWVAPLRLLSFLRSAYNRNVPDLYHVNWLQNALPLPRNGRPCVVSVLGADMHLLRLPLVTTLLRSAFRQRTVLLCPNANWMTPILAKSFGDLAEIRFVPFGIDPMWFQVQRDAAKFQQDWLCVSRVTRRKIGTLFEATADHFHNGEHSLHLFGPMQEDMALPRWVRYHGPARPEVLCRDWFPKAQGLVTLSQHTEGRPQVMLEAMAAGLPVVASRIPAHEELIQHGCTGWLCDAASDVTDGFRVLSDRTTNRQIGLAAQQWVANTTGTWEDCANRYVHAYRTVLGIGTA